MRISTRLFHILPGACIIGLFLVVLPGVSLAQTHEGAFINSTVANVNNEILTERELFFTLLREHGSKMFDDLVENEIIAGEAGILGAVLEPGEVDEYLATVYTPDKLQTLNDAFGADLVNQTVSTELLAFKTVMAKIDKVVAERQVVVTDEEIQQFYLANLPAWTTPESVRFSLIETATQAEAAAAKARVAAGETFGDVARAVSTHSATKAYGGDIGGLVPRGYSTGSRAILEETAFSLEPDQMSDPVEADSKWYVILTTEKTAYKEPTLDEMRDKVHAIILDAKVEPYLEEWRSSLWDAASIEVKYPIYLNIQPTDFSTGEEGSFIAPVVAVVNGKSIPESALFFHLLREHGGTVVQALIENIILSQQADSMGISVSVADARARLADIYEADKLSVLDAAFTPDVINTTMTRELSALDVMGSRIQQIVQEQGIVVTDEQIMQYFLDNVEGWSRPEMVRFSILVTTTQQESIAARQRIVGGESFDAVCREVSINEATRPYGGDIGDYIRRGMAAGENKIIEDTAFSLAVGSVSQPFQVGATWFLVKVTDKQDAYEPTYGEKADEIRARLLQDRVAPFMLAWRRELWENADITIAYSIFSDTNPQFGPEGVAPGQ